MIDRSYALLSEPERALLRRLGIFSGSFSLQGAIIVTADPPIASSEVFDLLAMLVDKSLVVRLQGDEPTRYRLLETTRAFALERLQNTGELDPWKHLCGYMADVFSDAEYTWPTMPTAEWLAAYEPELDNLRTALGWAFGPHGVRETLGAYRYPEHIAKYEDALRKAGLPE